MNDDDMSPNTVNLEIVCIRMFWSWLQEEEMLFRPIKVNSVPKVVENRTCGEPFDEADLKLICKAIDDWVKETPQANNFGNRDLMRNLPPQQS